MLAEPRLVEAACGGDAAAVEQLQRVARLHAAHLGMAAGAGGQGQVGAGHQRLIDEEAHLSTARPFRRY